MTVAEIKALIPAVITRFKERIPQSAMWINDVAIHIATRRTAETLFYATMQDLDARTKAFDPNTAAEVFTGKNGYVIIVYQYSIRSEKDFRHILWHELGHICSHYDNRDLEEEAYHQSILRLDTSLVSGYAVWMEFIAVCGRIRPRQPGNSMVIAG